MVRFGRWELGGRRAYDRALAVVVTALVAGCAQASRATPESLPSPNAQRPTRWVDSVLATMSPRDKAAQLVWPQLFGDYAPLSTPGWTRLQRVDRIADRNRRQAQRHAADQQTAAAHRC